MLSYPLAWLEAAGVTEVVIVCPFSHRSLISHFVHSESHGSFPSLSVKIETLEDDESMGTADVLREFADSFQADLIVLPCDFIPPPELSLSTLLDAYRMDTEESMLAALLYERGEVVKDGPPLFVAGLNEKKKILLHVPTEEPDEDLQLRMSLMWKSPHVRFTSRYLPAHVYVLKRNVLELLSQRTDISSIKEDLIPWLCRTQYRRATRRKYGPTLVKQGGNPQSLALGHSTVQPPIKSALLRTHHHTHLNGSAGNDDEGDLESELMSPQSPPISSAATSEPMSPRIHAALMTFDGQPKGGSDVDVCLRCTYVAHKLENGVAARANTLKSYFEANRLCLKEGSYIAPSPHQPSTSAASANLTSNPINPLSTLPDQLIDRRAQISSDSLIGASTRVGERTSIKKTVIGSHCTIGKGVKISGCVLMDFVVVKDNAKLDNTILSRHVVVEEKSTAKDCEAATGVVLAAGGEYKGERLEQFDYDEE
ncbi:hypothetical protein FRB96_005982 [Tulasnella sp. 330]|nr:hypothetical protein FRB96_005982 [Tulasnella sp. 330]KAG8882152.1 hypothetical protein FRB97_008640 [Tulasnella sp. 331]KAG8887724.1 hypothetical protein FRB98_009108 [Tulasnella sp. 332]